MGCPFKLSGCRIGLKDEAAVAAIFLALPHIYNQRINNMSFTFGASSMFLVFQFYHL
jgi:hypothetical protein